MWSNKEVLEILGASDTGPHIIGLGLYFKALNGSLKSWGQGGKGKGYL